MPIVAVTWLRTPRLAIQSKNLTHTYAAAAATQVVKQS